MDIPEGAEIDYLEERNQSNLAGVPPRNYEDLPKHVPIDWLKNKS